MGTITRSFANNITTSGVLLPASLNNNSIANVTSYNAAIATGNMVLISSQTASASASISFTTGIDSTYKEYQFYFINIHPSTDANFIFNASIDSGSNYNVTKTSTIFVAYHYENDTGTALIYDNNNKDLAQSTAFQSLTYGGDLNSDADSNFSGSLTLFNPSSTTYVKHFISTSSSIAYTTPYLQHTHLAGYCNTTSAVNAIQFKMSTGNIDDGTILMYGIV
jgi:hypothetical protein